MKRFLLPHLRWDVFVPSFKKQLSLVLSYDRREAKAIIKKAKKRYKEIISSLPVFDKNDRFRRNIISCARLSSFILSRKEKPSVDSITDYYGKSRRTKLRKRFCRRAGKEKFTKKDIRQRQKTALRRSADVNPYSWNRDFIPYKDNSGYLARFTSCGICRLRTDLSLKDYIPCMCHLDYARSQEGKASRFYREHTLAEGGPYCDCGYRKRKE